MIMIGIMFDAISVAVSIKAKINEDTAGAYPWDGRNRGEV
jgi:hypothetical protein